MSFLFPKDDPLIDEATSEEIPVGTSDLHKNFEIADKVKSNAITPQKAVAQFLKRLSNKNPNVQLLTLELIDTCVKNSGINFIQKITTLEFLDSLENHLIGPTNPQVKEKILGLIQQWSLLFKEKPELYLMNTKFNELKDKGYQFPKLKGKIDPMLIETTLAPPWTDSDYCTRCRQAFTTFNRKHHCRNCGKTFCQECSSRTMALPRLGINDAVRVCESCFSKINGTTTPNEPIEQENMQEDTELERAIQESLKLSKKQSEPRKSTSTPKPAKDDYDEDLKKAIEASLKESQPNYEQQNQLIQNHVSNHVKDSRAPNISPTEIENIRLFCELVEKIEKQGGNMEQLMNMYQNTILLQRKLVMQIEDCANLYKELYDFNTEVNEAIREYDALQQKRATFSKGNPTYVGQIFTQNYYPSPGYTPSHPIQPGYPFAHAPGQLQSSEHPHTFTSYPISNTGMPNEGATPFAPPLTMQSRESQFSPNIYQPDLQYQLNAANNYLPNQQQGALAATTQVGYPPQSYSSVPQPNQNPQLQASYPPMNPQYSFQGTQQIQHHHQNQSSANDPKVAPQDEPLIQL